MNVTICCFSPTKTTLNNLKAVAEGIARKYKVIDITLPASREGEIPEFGEDDLVLFGAPCYGGRLPLTASEWFEKLSGNGASCVVASVYGNRAFDDQLAEMEDLFTQRGFKVIGAAAMLGEHSMSKKIAPGRPNRCDLEKARTFGKKLQDKLEISGAKPLEKCVIPGNRPYKERGAAANNPGPATTESCVGCMLCAGLCPGGAIDAADPKKVAGEKCIRCNACVKSCPMGAKYFENGAAAEKFMLEKFGAPDREPQFWV